jgi:hypothetical protein
MAFIDSILGPSCPRIEAMLQGKDSANERERSQNSLGVMGT